jgi:hypothetical protein
MACRTCRQSIWTPASARVRPPDTRLDTVSADESPLRRPGSRWPGDGHGGPLKRSVGRTPQFNVTAQPIGMDPVRTAATKRRTPPAPSIRPCVRSAGHRQPRGLHVLALTGQEAMRMLPSANPSRYQHRHPSVVTPAPLLDAGTSASLVPVRCPRGRVRRPRWTPRSDSLPDTACPVDPAGHRPLHPARPGEPEATRTGNGRTARKAFGHPRPPRPQGGPPGHAELSCGPAFAAWQPRSAWRWQDCQRDRNHGSDQAVAWCRSIVQAAPRRTAVLGSDGWSVERAAKLHPLWQDGGCWPGRCSGVVWGLVGSAGCVA